MLPCVPVIHFVERFLERSSLDTKNLKRDTERDTVNCHEMPKKSLGLSIDNPPKIEVGII